MNRGCVIALVIFALCVLLLIVAVVVVPLVAFDIVRSAPRVPVATFITGETVAAITIDPNQKHLLDMLNQTGGQFGWFMPHELGAVVDLNADKDERTLTLVGSPKHLGPAFMLMFSDPTIFPADEFGVDGIDEWSTPTITKEKGAIILRGSGAVSDETEQAAAASWPADPARQSVTFEGGHALEFVAVNAGGESLRALQPLLDEDNELADTEDTTTDETGSPDEPMAEEAVDPDSVTVEAPTDPASETTPPAEAPEYVSSQHEQGEEEPSRATLVDLLLYASSVRIVGDFSERDAFVIKATATCPTEEAAATAKDVLDTLTELLRTDFEADEITVTGSSEASGTTATAEVTMTGFEERFIRFVQENQR